MLLLVTAGVAWQWQKGQLTLTSPLALIWGRYIRLTSCKTQSGRRQKECTQKHCAVYSRSMPAVYTASGYEYPLGEFVLRVEEFSSAKIRIISCSGASRRTSNRTFLPCSRVCGNCNHGDIWLKYTMINRVSFSFMGVCIYSTVASSGQRPPSLCFWWSP